MGFSLFFSPVEKKFLLYYFHHRAIPILRFRQKNQQISARVGKYIHSDAGSLVTCFCSDTCRPFYLAQRYTQAPFINFAVILFLVTHRFRTKLGNPPLSLLNQIRVFSSNFAIRRSPIRQIAQILWSITTNSLVMILGFFIEGVKRFLYLFLCRSKEGNVTTIPYHLTSSALPIVFLFSINERERSSTINV